MKIAEINKVLADPKMQNKNTNFKIIANVGKKPTIADVLKEMHLGFAQINARIDGVEKSINARIDNLEHRIDNLIKVNNLKE